MKNITRQSHGQGLITKEHIAISINLKFNFTPTLYSSVCDNSFKTVFVPLLMTAHSYF